MSAKYAILGGLLGAGAVTAVGVYLAVQDLQSPETQARSQARAVVAAQNTIANVYGLTPSRLQQIQQISNRFRTT